MIPTTSTRLFANISRPLSLALLLLSPLPVLSAASSYVWLEEPAQTNFPQQLSWDNLRGGDAPAVIRKSQADSLQIAYAFDVLTPGGEFNLWGRAFDPQWSSPARWRIDEGAWQTWEPGPAVDRQIANKIHVIEWRRWGSVQLAPGEHRLEIELTGPRKTGDMRYFVLDALLLLKGDFVPKGTESPDELVAGEQAVVKVKLSQLKDTGDYAAQADAYAREAQDEDLAKGLDGFRKLNASLDRALEAKAVVAGNQDKRLSGRAESVAVKGHTLELSTQWSLPFEGKLWVAILQGDALYCAEVKQVPLGAKHAFSVELPRGIPSGELTVIAVPVGQPMARALRAEFDSPFEAGSPVMKPASWGIYRDNDLRAHPWSVTEGGMMRWDGEPFIPVGGMINTKLSWASAAGDTRLMRSDVLEAQIKLLKDHGIRDIYFNGFFMKANPAALAHVVGLAEKYGMHYGLHVATSPRDALRSPGFEKSDHFSRWEPLNLASGAASATIEYRLAPEEFVSGGRCIWMVLSDSDEVLAAGVGVPETRVTDAPKPPPGTKGKGLLRLYPKLTQAQSLKVAFGKPLEKAGRLIYIPEVRMSKRNPSGFVDGMETHLRELKEVYGSLSLGAGMRMWVDPFNNELHSRNTQICTSPTFLNQYAAELLKRYGSIDKLNETWGVTGEQVPDFLAASRLIPVQITDDRVIWIDPVSQAVYTCAARSGQSLHDLTRFKGAVAEEMISLTADVLKDIADVPVVLKHNTFFSDWLVNPRTSGGQDGLGYEAYCYGDSLAYHNTLVPLAEALSSARRQWTLITETSPAAFDGQKDYVGYLDRLQMLNDFDLMTLFGAKGVYAFGFVFDPPRKFQITELIRDPRQLEWMATYAKTVRAAGERLSGYIPEVYGWYPVSLREKELTGDPLVRYEMDGQYIGTTGQIRMAPDGRWIIPALNLQMGLQGYLVPWDFLTKPQQETLVGEKPEQPVWLLRDPEGSTVPKAWTSYPLDAYTASGIGVIPPEPKAMTLDEFRQKVLGYRVFQTEGINGQTLPDGSLLIWTCVEREQATVRLPAAARLENLQGETLETTPAGNGAVEVTLVQSPHEKLTGDLPDYLQHMPSGYYYKESPQAEVAIVKGGVSVDELLKLNPPAWHRWLPAAIEPEAVAAWVEAEDFASTTFVQPRLEGYSRYSGGAAIGMNTHWDAPAGDQYSAEYDVEASSPFSRLWVRRMDRPAMDVQVYVDGALVGEIPAKAEMSDLLHLNPWNAGLAAANMHVGWIELALPETYSSGRHTVEIVALSGKDDSREIDVALLGGQSEKAMEKQAEEEGSQLMAMQIDALMLTQ
ncbi:MAG: hypothetical protein Q7Q73_05955 [Verrucomicrobiota bacterium JB024]|nr:hypothetical protein [Verrucomicrobiota bacterium JB024]